MKRLGLWPSCARNLSQNGPSEPSAHGHPRYDTGYACTESEQKLAVASAKRGWPLAVGTGYVCTKGEQQVTVACGL